MVNRLYERRFCADLTFAPPSRWRQSREFFLRRGQTFVQSLSLSLSMHGRADYQHPFGPFRFTLFRATGPLKRIALGRQDRFSSVIEPENPLQLASPVFRDPFTDPLCHRLGRRTGQGQRRQVHVLTPCHVGTGGQRTHLTIAHKEQISCAHSGLDALDERNVQAIIRSLPREHIRR